ncbi:MAG: DinB family protein [Candidatus Hodarchaeales archaeon]
MKVKDVIKTLNYALENQMKFIIQGLEKNDFVWRPENGAPSIGWTIGHILVNHDYIINHRVLGNPVKYEELSEVFGFGSKGDFPDDYNIEEILEKFKSLNQVVIKAIMSKEESWFEQKANAEGFPPNWQGKNNMKIFVLHFNHCFTHCGQILEVKRMMGKGAWGF